MKFSQNPILSCTPFRWRETDLVQQLLFRIQNSVPMLSNFILAERGGDDTAWGCRFERGVQIQLEQEISRSKLVVVAECSGTLMDGCGYTLEANCSGILDVGHSWEAYGSVTLLDGYRYSLEANCSGILTVGYR